MDTVWAGRPIAKVIGDAIAAIPDAAFAGDPAAARQQRRDLVKAVDDAMERADATATGSALQALRATVVSLPADSGRSSSLELGKDTSSTPSMAMIVRASDEVVARPRLRGYGTTRTARA